jgi:hypothetical protein
MGDQPCQSAAPVTTARQWLVISYVTLIMDKGDYLRHDGDTDDSLHYLGETGDYLRHDGDTDNYLHHLGDTGDYLHHSLVMET